MAPIPENLKSLKMTRVACEDTAPAAEAEGPVFLSTLSASEVLTYRLDCAMKCTVSPCLAQDGFHVINVSAPVERTRAEF